MVRNSEIGYFTLDFNAVHSSTSFILPLLQIQNHKSGKSLIFIFQYLQILVLAEKLYIHITLYFIRLHYVTWWDHLTYNDSTQSC